MNSTDAILTAFARTTDDMVTLDAFRERLDSGRPMTIKFGADVTAPFLHIGHAVNLWMMRSLQDHGHKVVFLIGDFTTRIGDPTGKSKTRAAVDRGSIEINAQRFIQQISGILITDDPDRFEVRRNSEWFDTMPCGELLELLAQVTHARLISRDMFRQRIQNNCDIRMHELIYPVLQGFDSVMLTADLTIVGSDQLFNEMMGRFFQERAGQVPQVIITTRITPGLDGVQKQSKSLGNYVAITDSSRDQFGKIMQLPDPLIPDWMDVYTTLPDEEIHHVKTGLASGTLHPRDAKLRLAHAVVERYHGPGAADREQEWFLHTFSQKTFPEDAPVVSVPAGEIAVLDLLNRLLPQMSRSDIRRLIQQGAVRIQDRAVDSEITRVTVAPGDTLHIRAGKRRFFRILPDPGTK